MIVFYSKSIRFLNIHLPWLLVMFLISLQSHITADNMGSSLGSSDKFTHFLVFGLLTWLITRAVFKGENTFLQQNYFWIVLIILGMFAVVDEMHQYFTPGRDSEILDWLADMSGAVIFLFIYKWRYRI
jgi:VanZ family protein